MRVVAVHAPRGQDSFGEAVLSRPADVVHDLVAPSIGDRASHADRDVVEGFVPGDPHPLTRAAPADPLERIENAIGVGDLVERGRTLGAVPAPRARMFGVAFELPDLQGVLVHVRQQPARRFAVEAGGGDKHVPLFDPPGPRFGVQLDPVVPPLLGRERGQMELGA